MGSIDSNISPIGGDPTVHGGQTNNFENTLTSLSGILSSENTESITRKVTLMSNMITAGTSNATLSDQIVMTNIIRTAHREAQLTSKVAGEAALKNEGTVNNQKEQFKAIKNDPKGRQADCEQLKTNVAENQRKQEKLVQDFRKNYDSAINTEDPKASELRSKYDKLGQVEDTFFDKAVAPLQAQIDALADLQQEINAQIAFFQKQDRPEDRKADKRPELIITADKATLKQEDMNELRNLLLVNPDNLPSALKDLHLFDQKADENAIMRRLNDEKLMQKIQKQEQTITDQDLKEFVLMCGRLNADLKPK